MGHPVPIWLRLVVPSVLLCIGSAHARDLSAANAAESVLVTQAKEIAGGSALDAASFRSAHAQDLPPPDGTAPLRVTQRQYMAVDGSFDADSLGSGSVNANVTFAPFGIYETGLRLRVAGNASWYQFLTSENPRTIGKGRSLEGSILAGHGISVPRFNLSWLIGAAFGESVNEGIVTDRWGAKAVLSMYAIPTDYTMASGSVAYSTIANDVQVQIKAGQKVFQNVYFGPEAKFTWKNLIPYQTNISSTAVTFTSTGSPQTQVANMRVGAHLSALSFGPLLVGVSAGWARDRYLGDGYYGSAWVYQPF